MANQPYSERERLIWRIRARNPEQERRLADAVGVSPVTAALLANRGIVSPEQAKAYFSPSIGQLCDPFTLPDMPEAVRLLNSAIDNRRAVLVHGDYDVDGLTATALLVRFISKLGLDVKYFIPHRIYDHYGLSSRVMEEAAQGGVSVVIAVDCGVRDFEAVNRARELGMSVIVLDHHEPGERLPRAAAIVDPKLPHSIYPNRELTSAGLALQLARAVAQSRNIPVEYVERAFIDLAAIGTIADVAPLRDENRALTAVGLRQLGRTQKIGLRTLMNLCRINGTPKAEHVAFRLAPRMNAPGRLADPNPALTLLLTTDQDEANRVALYLDSLNRQRQKEQSAICDE
ncbi:MAG: single-stranded-DNA-specific exonuclease RecJ, partial [Candidatus Zipacnadales bacterium]